MVSHPAIFVHVFSDAPDDWPRLKATLSVIQEIVSMEMVHFARKRGCAVAAPAEALHRFNFVPLPLRPLSELRRHTKTGESAQSAAQRLIKQFVSAVVGGGGQPIELAEAHSGHLILVADPDGDDVTRDESSCYNVGTIAVCTSSDYSSLPASVEELREALLYDDDKARVFGFEIGIIMHELLHLCMLPHAPFGVMSGADELKLYSYFVENAIPRSPNFSEVDLILLSHSKFINMHDADYNEKLFAFRTGPEQLRANELCEHVIVLHGGRVVLFRSWPPHETERTFHAKDGNVVIFVSYHSTVRAVLSDSAARRNSASGIL